jgi:hypothetical protein
VLCLFEGNAFMFPFIGSVLLFAPLDALVLHTLNIAHFSRYVNRCRLQQSVNFGGIAMG